jgi:predicted homoserine dehydrogenase-like protein
MGSGPFYTLVQPNILVHLEAFKTLERVVAGGPPLLHNTAQPRLSVAAVAKRALSPGEKIDRGCGSFELRGACVRIADQPDHLPIGLADDLVIRHAIEPGQVLTLGDVEIEDSPPLALWREIAATARVAPQRRQAAGG